MVWTAEKFGETYLIKRHKYIMKFKILFSFNPFLTRKSYLLLRVIQKVYLNEREFVAHKFRICVSVHVKNGKF